MRGVTQCIWLPHTCVCVLPLRLCVRYELSESNLDYQHCRSSTSTCVPRTTTRGELCQGKCTRHTAHVCRACCAGFYTKAGTGPTQPARHNKWHVSAPQCHRLNARYAAAPLSSAFSPA